MDFPLDVIRMQQYEGITQDQICPSSFDFKSRIAELIITVSFFRLPVLDLNGRSWLDVSKAVALRIAAV